MVIDPSGSEDSLKTLRIEIIFLSVSELVPCTSRTSFEFPG